MSIATFVVLVVVAAVTGMADADAAVAPAGTAVEASDTGHRGLQANGCWGTPPPAAWHPNYAGSWADGACHFVVDCNSPSYSTNSECCKGAFGGQTSGKCLSMLPSALSMSTPAEAGALNVYYPDYDLPWSQGICTNTGPLPPGRSTYSTMRDCCDSYFGWQASGKCVSMTLSSPKTTPAALATMDVMDSGELDIYYPDYTKPWTEGICTNTGPVPSGRPEYATMLDCCRAAYGGQASGTCLTMLPSPPTASPVGGELDGWYADYRQPWSMSYCVNTRPLPSGRPMYATVLECCAGAYGGQMSGTCLAMLPSPPTMSPTEGGGLDVWYPDYSQPSWPDGYCINLGPVPSGRPTYATMLECCTSAYGGQVSGTCLAMLPSPPTASPTEGGGSDVWYPDYSQPSWPDGYCINLGPVPSGRPTYATMLECCTSAYGGQVSGKCLAMLPSPPTASPTEGGGLDVWYPDYSQPSWPDGYCINLGPVPSGRPTYATMLECCTSAYGGQVSGKCLAMLPSPPTASPTEGGELDVWYPDYSQPSWPDGYCINLGPVPSGRSTYTTMLECCKSAYGGQVSGKCLAMLPSPPTMSPTEGGELDVWYPDYSQPSWPDGYCINIGPVPSGRPTYATPLECCKSAYGGQASGTCISMLPSPPTTSPTGVGGVDIFYPDYRQPSWNEGFCTNTLPIPSGRPTYSTMLECCKSAYGGQTSGTCISMLPSPPTTSPTGVGGVDIFYPDYSQPSWNEGFCINTLPTPSGRPTYSTMLDCCKINYAGQTSGTCLSMLPSPPTTSPTGVELDLWYPDYSTAWAEATCLNTPPAPSGRPTFVTTLACCKAEYPSQPSGACLAALPSPPTLSPSGGSTINSLSSGTLGDSYPNFDQASTLLIPLSSDGLNDLYQYNDLEASLALNLDSGGLDVYYPNYDRVSWSEGSCINTPPLPPGRPSHSTKQACCQAHYGDQTSDICMCEAIGVCYSCECGSQAERGTAGCDIICPAAFEMDPALVTSSPVKTESASAPVVTLGVPLLLCPAMMLLVGLLEYCLF